VKTWDGDGVVVEEDGVALGLVEDHSAIFHRGRDRAGFLAEEHVGGFSGIHGIFRTQATFPIL